MKFNVNVKELGPHGYKFQKLYAMNYKCYHKKLKFGHKLWLWVKGMEIEVNDWYNSTESLIKFYVENKDHSEFNEISFTGKPKNYIKVQLNPENNFVQLYDNKEYFLVFDKARQLPKDRIGEAWKDWENKYGTWHNEIILSHESMIELIDEINFLTGRNLWNEFAVKPIN